MSVIISLYSVRYELSSFVGSQICEISRNSERIRACSRRRSSKVIDPGVNRKHICDFLLVIKSSGCNSGRQWVLMRDALIVVDVVKANSQDGSGSHWTLTRHWQGRQQHQTSYAGHRLSHPLPRLQPHQCCWEEQPGITADIIIMMMTRGRQRNHLPVSEAVSMQSKICLQCNILWEREEISVS